MSSDETNYKRMLASASAVRQAFHEHRTELEWVAYFVTGNREIAAACVANACCLSECHYNIFEEWVLTWVRYSTIRSAAEMKREVIMLVARSYEHCPSIRKRQPLEGELLEFLVDRPEFFIQKLDVISRCALVICGIQGNTVGEAAALLGITRSIAEAAYSAGINYLETTWLKLLGAKQNCSAMWNAEVSSEI
jgi:hypothetical protein